jgi:hypothetical protein
MPRTTAPRAASARRSARRAARKDPADRSARRPAPTHPLRVVSVTDRPGRPARRPRRRQSRRARSDVRCGRGSDRSRSSGPARARRGRRIDRDRPGQVRPCRGVDDLLGQRRSTASARARSPGENVARTEPIASLSDSADAAESDARRIRSSIAVDSPMRVLPRRHAVPVRYRASCGRSRNIRRRRIIRHSHSLISMGDVLWRGLD